MGAKKTVNLENLEGLGARRLAEYGATIWMRRRATIRMAI
jgi:hypothetical protein